MSKRKQDKKHLSKIASLGCCVCNRELNVFSPCEIHHTRFSCGVAQRSDDNKAIGLCFNHHSAQGVDGYHKHPKTWQESHGTEQELLKWTLKELNIE